MGGVVFVESSEFIWNSILSTKELTDAHASTSWKRQNRDAWNGRAMF